MIIDIITRVGQHPLHDFKQTPEDIVETMETFNIDKSFVHPFPNMKTQQNNDMVAKAVERYPNKLVGFAGIDPTSDNAISEIKRAFDIGLKGVMLDPEFHKFMRQDLENLEALMVPCMEYKMPVIFNTENVWYSGNEYYFNGLDTLAFKFPDVKMVVNIWWPRVDELMRRHSNILLCTGGHHNVPGVLPLLNKVGPTRIMMGSESPVMHPAMIIKDLRYKKMPDVYRDLILGKNAERYFKYIL